MNETDRMLIALTAAAWIVAMVVVIFLTWAAPDRTIERLDDVVQFFRDNNTTAGQLVITLGAAALTVLALLIIILEFAPEDEPSELRVEQAGATTIVPADALRLRLEEALLALPDVTSARSHVWSRDKGIAAEIDLTLTPTANVGDVSQEATRVVVDTVHTDLGLPVAGMPKMKIAFGGSKVIAPHEAATFAPATVDTTPLTRVETVDERVETPPEVPAASPDASPGPLIYDESPAADQTPQP
jgi:hypothetical protein